MNTELEKQAIQYLKSFEPNADEEPYYLAYSGGKDSDTILILAELAGVRFEAVHNLTTVDAPETVNYIKSNPLYECGFKRIGCVGCPMADKHRYVEFNRYPKYKLNYIRAFDRMLKARK